MKTILIARTTVYLGRHVAIHYCHLGWNVRALVRNKDKAIKTDLKPSLIFF